jgi:hypothetical protein
VIHGLFYHEELTPVRLTSRSTFKIDKILGKRVRRGVLHYLVRWKGYTSNFDSCVPRRTYKIFKQIQHVQYSKPLLHYASQILFLINTLAAFTAELAQTIDLEPNDEWEVGLSELAFPPQQAGTVKPVTVVGQHHALIYCNLIKPQFAGDKLIRCLRTFIPPSLYCQHFSDNIHYMPVENRHIRRIRIEIKDLTGKPTPFKNSTVHIKLVLHFRRIPYI